jgi:hypothetical protein
MPKAMRNLLAVVLLAVSAVTFTTLAHAQTPTPTPAPQPTITPAPVPTVSAEEQAKQERLLRQQKHQLRKQIRHDQRATWRWQDVMLKRRTHPAKPVARISSLNWLQHAAKYWHKRLRQAVYLAHHPPHKWLWLCIHRQEGSWTDNASNNPHWGGLQMGWWFMKTYARKLLVRFGKANNWPPLQQIWVAERAFKREHYSLRWLTSQWVPTASRCI